MIGVEYEFTEHQEQQISGLTNKMGQVGSFLVLVGVLIAIAALVGLLPVLFGDSVAQLPDGTPDDLKLALGNLTAAVSADRTAVLYGSAGTFIQGIIFVAVGLYTRRAKGAFEQVVDTEGNDISNLMNAIGALKSLFSLMASILMLGILLAVCAIVLRIYLQSGL